MASPASRLRILLLAHNVRGSGTYYRFDGFATHLAAQGHDVTLVAASSGRQLLPRVERVNGVRLVLTPTWLSPRMSNGGLAPEDIISRLPSVFDHPYDIVHASEHRPAASLPAAILQKLHLTAYISDWADLWGRDGIMTERSLWARTLLSGLETASENRIHASADAMTVICTDLHQRALALGHPPDRVLNLPNGIDLEEIKPLSDRADGRQRLGLPVDAKLLVFAGEAPIRMDLVWDSFRLVHDRFPDAYLILLGRQWRIPERMGEAAGHVMQMGKIATPDYYLALASGDVMLLPYPDTARNRGRWPGKLNFYMAAGRPTVANPTGDIRALFEQHQIGLLAAETPLDFARAVNTLLSDPSLADSSGRNARDLTRQHYAWPPLVEKLAAFYHTILSQS
jgi:glycosyltransferase involved in cell wall biosynthesis